MKRGKASWPLLALALALGCDDQQYVNPDTVSLVIRKADDAAGKQRVNRCHYVPVLAGSRVIFRYEVDDELKAVLAVSREEVVVTFEPPKDSEPVRIFVEDLLGEASPGGNPPEGYEVELSAGCTPSDEYR